MAHDILKISHDFVAPRSPVIELGEVAPFGFAARIGRVARRGRENRTLRVMRKPIGMAARQLAVLRGMVEHEIHDHAQPALFCRGGEFAQQPVVADALATAQPRVQPVIILDGVKTSGKSGKMKRVEIDRVEAHRRNARQMFGPLPNGPGQCRKEVIDTQAVAHEIHPRSTARRRARSQPTINAAELLGICAVNQPRRATVPQSARQTTTSIR